MGDREGGKNPSHEMTTDMPESYKKTPRSRVVGYILPARLATVADVSPRKWIVPLTVTMSGCDSRSVPNSKKGRAKVTFAYVCTLPGMEEIFSLTVFGRSKMGQKAVHV
jgi:hypothetical protein